MNIIREFDLKLCTVECPYCGRKDDAVIEAGDVEGIHDCECCSKEFRFDLETGDSYPPHYSPFTGIYAQRS